MLVSTPVTTGSTQDLLNLLGARSRWLLFAFSLHGHPTLAHDRPLPRHRPLTNRIPDVFDQVWRSTPSRQCRGSGKIGLDRAQRYDGESPRGGSRV